MKHIIRMYLLKVV